MGCEYRITKENRKLKPDKINTKEVSKSRAFMRNMFIFLGIVINVILAFAAHKLDLPVYVDTIGTIIVAGAGGLIPGIITAVVTSLLCGFFHSSIVYYAVLNATVAVLTSWFVYRGHHKNPVKVAGIIVLFALICGGLGAIFEWLLAGQPEYEYITDAIQRISQFRGMDPFAVFIALNICLNIVDKGVSLLIGLLVLHFIPEDKKQALRDSIWKQRPLSPKEIKDIEKKRSSHSLQTRVTMLIVLSALSITIIMAWISVSLYFENAKEMYLENAYSAVKFAAQVIDPSKVDDYIRYGEEVEGYKDTDETLAKILENSSGVQYLYVLQIRKDGCHVVFDVDTPDTPGGDPGDIYEFEEAFESYVPALLSGQEIAPVESDDITGWVLTVYHPVYDSSRRCVCYTCADVSMKYLSGYVSQYILRAVLFFSGFFLLIMCAGLWLSRSYLVYPIDSMTYAAGNFVYERDDLYDAADLARQQESVEKLKGLEIKTGDEVESLYKVLCTMTSDTLKQMKDIRHYMSTVTQMQNGLIITMADLVENRDSDTGAHIQKTAAYVRIILNGLKEKGYYVDKLTEKYMSDVEMSAPLHDVGKINIPDAILQKPGKLTPEEYEIMKTHTTAGKKILDQAISTMQGENYLKEARNMAAYHHEKWDGTGYPEGLYGEVIPLSARVMAVADVFDALSSKRCYKDAMPLDKALGIITEGAGTAFDPKVVEVFMDHLDEVKAVLKKYNEV